jgi:hypothetical protein
MTIAYVPSLCNTFLRFAGFERKLPRLEGRCQGSTMSKSHEARCMRLIIQLLRPQRVHDILIVAISDTNWMAQAVMEDGNDHRFRFQENRLYDEALVGDARVA